MNDGGDDDVENNNTNKVDQNIAKDNKHTNLDDTVEECEAPIETISEVEAYEAPVE